VQWTLVAINQHNNVQAGKESMLGFITCHDCKGKGGKGGYVYVECVSVSKQYTAWAKEGYTNVKGLGKELVIRAMKHAGAKPLEASIRAKNEPSRRCFESAAKACNRSFVLVKTDVSEIAKLAKNTNITDGHWAGVEAAHGLLVTYRMAVQE
jgi:hypothetical protein